MKVWFMGGIAFMVAACGNAPPPPATPPRTPAVASASAQVVVVPVPLTPERALERLFTTDSASSDWFAASFLSAIPITKVDEITQQTRKGGGHYKGARAVEGHWLLDFEHATIRADLALDSDGRFTGLMIRPEEVKTTTLEEALHDFRALEGKVSVLVLTDGHDQGAIEPETPLAVGSTFKLATLTELRAEIDKKKRSWSDVVQLRHDAKSLPSGVLQEWPDQAPLTLYTLAAMMISRSDNTATDMLIGVLGRNTIEPFASRNKPYLTTRDMFVLKAPANADLLARYRAGDEAARRALLKEIHDKPLPNGETYPKEPTALDVEWFFTTRELCGLMKGVHDLPLMSINPGVAKRKDWTSVAYKGGSEPGVINMTTWAEKGGHAHCVSATWNAPQKLDELSFTTAYKRILSFLKDQP